MTSTLVEVATAALASLAFIWVFVVVALSVSAAGGSSRMSARTALLFLPDLIRLIRRLAADPALSRRTRLSLWLAVGYLVSPIDLVPDFIPVVGQIDDVLVMVLVLRWVARTAGPAAITSSWPGSPDGLNALLRLLGVGSAGRAEDADP